MAAMAAISATVAERSTGFVMAGGIPNSGRTSDSATLPDRSAQSQEPTKQKSPAGEAGLCNPARLDGSLLAVAEQLQHHDEHVDEVEVEVERTHDRALGHRHRVVHHLVVVVLDLLGVIGGEAREHQH